MKPIFIFLLLLIGSPIFGQDNFVEKNDCEVDYNDLNVDFDRRTRLRTYTQGDELFTGCAKLDVPKNKMYFLHFVKNGRLEREVGYYYSGQKCKDYPYKNGYSHGTLQLFYEDGSPYIQEEYKYGRLHGSLKRWKNGQLVRDADFWEGVKISETMYELKEESKDRSGAEKLLDNC